MKTFTSFKNIFGVLAMLLVFSATAQGNYELSLVREIDNKTSELTFIRTEGDKKTTVVATDDDGFLSLAAINLALNQNTTEALMVVANAAEKRGENGLQAAYDKWNSGMSAENLAKFPSLKPAILSSLSRYAAYSAKEEIRLNNLIQRTSDPETLSKLWEARQTVIAENKDALFLHAELMEKETLTRAELSATLGSLLKAYKGTHTYSSLVDGKSLALKLTGANALGGLFGTRAYRVDQFLLEDMKARRGSLFLAKDVFAITGDGTVEASSDTTSTEHVDSVVEKILEADSM